MSGSAVAPPLRQHLTIAPGDNRVERTERNKIDAEEITGVIREAVINEHEVFARHIVLIRPNTLPKTTSGKIQRSLTRKLWQERKLDYLAPEAV